MGKKAPLICEAGCEFKASEGDNKVCATCSGAKADALTEEQRAKRTLEEHITSLQAALKEKEAALQGLDAVDAEIEAAELAAAAEAGAKPKKEKKAKKPKKAALIDTQPEQGCRDFPPEDFRLRDWLFSQFRSIALEYGFEEYDAPILEPENLYVVKAGKGDAKAGEEILEQMFNFSTKEGHRVAMRPEMTPTLARLIMQRGQSLVLPIKWFSIPQCWRNEAIVRGRRREHFQWNMDIWGIPSVTAEAELLSAVVRFLAGVGLTDKDVGIKINSRKLLQQVLKNAGVPDEKFQPVCIIIDKVDKKERCEIVEMLQEQGLGEDVIQTTLDSLSITDMAGVRRVAGEDSEVAKELDQLFSLCESYGIATWVQLDASVVRGLAYYTGVVFECFDRAGNLRAICGGGRYDSLMKTFGHTQTIPAAGFGFGDCVIIELLKDKGLLPDLKGTVEYIVIPFDEKMRAESVGVLSQLRDAGVPCDMILEKKRKPGQAFSYADRRGAKFAVLVAPREWEAGNVKVKDLYDAEDTAGVEMSVADMLKKATGGK